MSFGQPVAVKMENYDRYSCGKSHYFEGNPIFCEEFLELNKKCREIAICKENKINWSESKSDKSSVNGGPSCNTYHRYLLTLCTVRQSTKQFKCTMCTAVNQSHLRQPFVYGVQWINTQHRYQSPYTLYSEAIFNLLKKCTLCTVDYQLQHIKPIVCGVHRVYSG